MTTQEIIKLVKEQGIYDFISNNFWKLDNNQKQVIAKECAYLLATNTDTTIELVDNLKEQLGEE